MTLLLLAGSPSTSSRSGRPLHHAGRRLAPPGHASRRLEGRDPPAGALLRADFRQDDISAGTSGLR